MAYEHAWERLWLAVVYLATDAAPLRERALDAYQGYISDLRPEEFKAESRDLFLQLKNFVNQKLENARLNPSPWNPEFHSPVDIAKHKIRDITGRKIAEMIVKLYSDSLDED